MTSGSTFHSAGLVGQLRSSLALTRMMMNSVDLYRTLEAEVGLETGWREVGSLRLASSPERLEEITRQAGWAKTFGLPLELVSAAEAQALFPPMSTEGVLGAAYLPSDGYIDPSQLTFALAEGARRRGAEVNTNTRVTGITTERGEVTGVVTDKGVIETGIVINAGGMYAREIGALVGVTVPIIPMAHEYLVLEPSGLPLDMPTMRDPSLLVYFRPESGGLIMGGYERNCAPWSLDGIPADFNGKLLEEDWPRFEELMQNAIVRVPTLEGMGVIKLINGPEAFTPDGEFILGPVGGARVLGRGRILRARARRRGWDGAARRGVGDGGDALARRLAHGLAAVRRLLPIARVHARPHGRDLRDLLRRHVPGPRAHGRSAASRLAGLRASHRARCGIRREVGLGARELVRAECDRRRRVAATPGVGGEALVARRRRRAPGLPGGGCNLRRVVVRQDRRQRWRRGRIPRIAVREPGRTRRRRCHLYPDAERPRRDRVRLHGDPTRRGSLPDRHRHRVRPARPGVDPPACAARRVGARCRRHLGARVLRRLGTEREDVAAAADDDRPVERRVRLHAGAGAVDRCRAVSRGQGHLRRRARLGAVLPDRVRRAPVGHALGGGRGARPRRRRATRRSTRSDSRRATASGAPTSRPRTRRSPQVSASRSSSTRERSSAATRSSPTASPSTSSAASRSTIARAVALGSEPVRVGDRLVGRVTSGGYGYTVARSIAYAYLPAADADIGTRVAVEIFGEWVDGEVAAEPLFDPAAPASAARSSVSPPRARACPAAGARRTDR